jgi:DNA helicase II / ATP-dependent DNA helicase PcrA
MSSQLDLDRTPVWERDMNPEQLAAIRHQDGPCKLLAQAGAGKTRVLVHRIARMVAEGVDPARILAVTFSKKAADEMNDRLARLRVRDARVGTWHSLCLQILKEDSTPWSDWEVDETSRADVLLKEVCGYQHLNWVGADAGEVRSFVGLCKANLWAPGSGGCQDLAEKMFGREAGLAFQAYELYEQLREERGILTFDDFLVYAVRHLQASEERRLVWSTRWKYILVDEYQDNNRAQTVLQELLARDHRNLMAVGDVAQAIYSWRGSLPEYLVDFEREWPGAKVVSMNRNYRSGSKIVDAANAIIRPAAVRSPEDMVAERGTEGSVDVRCSQDLDDEGENFASWVQETMRAEGAKFDSFCALFRTNAQSRALEEALLKRRIPYVVVGGSSFYNRKEVRSLLGYLRVAAGRDDDGDGLKRSINAPFRYLGRAFVDKVVSQRSGTWVEKVEAVAGGGFGVPRVQARQRQSALQWADLITRVAARINSDDPEQRRPEGILGYVVHETRYIEWLEKDEGGEGLESSHAANVREMIRIAERFDTVDALLDYIEDMARAARRQRADGQAGGERVLLMSIHRSKGLEWPNVWVNGCNELVLPHVYGDPEEERRLMYVAATRARDRLVFSHVRSFAAREGVRPDARPSRFLVEAGLVAEHVGAVASEAR